VAAFLQLDSDISLGSLDSVLLPQHCHHHHNYHWSCATVLETGHSTVCAYDQREAITSADLSKGNAFLEKDCPLMKSCLKMRWITYYKGFILIWMNYKLIIPSIYRPDVIFTSL
jgi:hypothetical protein